MALGSASGLGGATAFAQQVRPTVKGRAHRVKVDSSPQQAAVYWSAGTGPLSGQPKDYGIAGYTPITLKVPRGAVTFVVELQGFKAQQKALDIKKSQTINVTLERAPAMAKVDLPTTDATATGADVKIDGVSRGTLPGVFEVAAGRHQVEVNKAGMKPWTQWFEPAEGEHLTHDVSLASVQAASGTLIVTSDAGGDVYVDGVRKDVAPTSLMLPAGDHVVEVRKDGAPAWRQTATVASGQETKVAATFGANAGKITGSLRIVASEIDTEVYVDGEDKGRSPVNATDLSAGEHIVEGRKVRFKAVQETVRVKPGESTVVQLKMELAPLDRPHGSLKVQSPVPNAEVFVDGASLGRSPVDRNDLDPGKHSILVHKDGYTDYKRDVILIENQPITLVADLSATGSIRVLSAPEGAEVRIDGELIGKTPIQRDGHAVGSHVLEVDLKGFFMAKQTIKIEGGRENLFSFDLKPIPTGPTPEQSAKRKAGMSSFGAKVNPVGGVTTDFGFGYPYIFMARATVGAFNIRPLGLDIGVEFKTFFQIYEFSGHGRLQLVETGPLSIAARGDVGGGFGPSGRNTYFADIEPVASLAFSNVATVSVSARWSLWTDRFCPSQLEVDNGVGQSDYCKDPTTAEAVLGPGAPDRRISGSRLLIGFAAVASLNQLVSVFAQVEFVPGLAPAPRLAYLDKANSVLFEKDPLVYGTLGLSLKF